MSHGISYDQWSAIYNPKKETLEITLSDQTVNLIQFIKNNLFKRPPDYSVTYGVSIEVPGCHWYPDFDAMLDLESIVIKEGWEGVQLHTCKGKIYLTLVRQACHVEASEAQRIFVEETGVLK
jgi:hypothetical protein